MPQRVLMIASTSFFSDYGGHVRIWQEIQALQRRGHRVVLATYHNGDDMPGVDTRRSWDVPWIKRAVVGSSRHKLYLDVGLSWRALRVALRERPTLVHAHTHEAGLIGLTLARGLRVPLVLDYQGSMTSEMLDHGFVKAGSPFYRPLRAVEHMINRSADAVITSTHNAAALLRQEGTIRPGRLYTVTDGVNTDRFRPFDGSPAWETQRRELRAQLGIPQDRRLVVFVGLLQIYQGTHALIEAASILVPRLPDVHFLIMGYPDPASYRAYAASLGVGTHVTLPGRVLYKDLPAYLALGDVAVAPKMSRTEGNGKIADYLAAGLPVVAFDTPASHEMLGDIGIYAAYGSAADLAAKLELALTDRDMAQRLGNAGRTHAVTHYSWDAGAEQIESIYHEILARRAPAATPSPISDQD